jgi:hypothetical protein
MFICGAILIHGLVATMIYLTRMWFENTDIEVTYSRILDACSLWSNSNFIKFDQLKKKTSTFASSLTNYI